MSLPDMKFRVTPEQSKAIQEKLFQMGYAWAGAYAETFVRFEKAPYLFFSEKGIQMCGGDPVSDTYFDADPAEEYKLIDGEFRKAAIAALPKENGQPAPAAESIYCHKCGHDWIEHDPSKPEPNCPPGGGHAR